MWNGFYINNMYKLSGGNWVLAPGKTLNYIAVKYK